MQFVNATRRCFTLVPNTTPGNNGCMPWGGRARLGRQPDTHLHTHNSTMISSHPQPAIMKDKGWSCRSVRCSILQSCLMREAVAPMPVQPCRTPNTHFATQQQPGHKRVHAARAALRASSAPSRRASQQASRKRSQQHNLPQRCAATATATAAHRVGLRLQLQPVPLLGFGLHPAARSAMARQTNAYMMIMCHDPNGAQAQNGHGT